MAHELHVPVRQLDARVFTEDGIVHDVTLFLPADHGVEHLLEGTETFVPISEEGRVRIFARASLAAVGTKNGRDPEVAAPDADDFLTERRALIVRLRGGATIEGTLRHAPAVARPRTADLLNEASPTFSLDGDGIAYRIAKAHVACVDEV